MNVANVEWSRNFVYLVYHFYVICMARTTNILHGQRLSSASLQQSSVLLKSAISSLYYQVIACPQR